VLLAAGAIFTLPPAAQERFASVLRNSALAPFIGLNSVIIETRERAVATDTLRAVINALTVEVQSLATADEENRRLRDLLLLRDRLPTGWIAAEASRPGLQASEGIFYLDVGGADGIRERAPVVTREGLAGVVRGPLQGGSQAEGMDWSHPEFAASAMSADGLITGIVESRRGAFREQDGLVLLGTEFNTLLDSGTVISTSGLGGVFPRGIPIGRIERVLVEPGPDGEQEADADLRGFERNYVVTPFVDPGEMTLVLVERADSRERMLGLGVEPDPPPPGDSIGDLSAAWPPDERMRAFERAQFMPVWRDSLRVLRDSIARLLGQPPDTAGRPGGSP
jgi:rod shape-determining protein MreC